MKLFFAVFAAILCAAGVIWGVYAGIQKQKEETATIVRIFELAAKGSEMNYDRVSKYDSLDPLTISLAMDSAKTLEQMLKAKRAPADRVRKFVGDFVFNWERILEHTRQNHPDQDKWVEEMERAIQRVESAHKKLTF